MANDSATPIVNKTGSAVVAVTILVYSMSMATWLTLFGKSENGLHQQSLSWSYIMMGVVMAALGLAPFVAQIMPLLRKPGG